VRDFSYFIDPDGSFTSDKRITEQIFVFCSESDMLKMFQIMIPIVHVELYVFNDTDTVQLG
jgi:hypothetical protein